MSMKKTQHNAVTFPESFPKKEIKINSELNYKSAVDVSCYYLKVSVL